MDTIGSGEVKEFEVEPGEHTLKTRIDWYSSGEVIFTASDTMSKALKYLASSIVGT